MNFYNFYVFFLFFTENLWRINSSADFDVIELEHLSDKLRPTECLRLLNAIYSPTPVDTSEKLFNADAQTSENCQTKLKEWNHTFPEKERARARKRMEVTLRNILKRPELANYVKRGRRLVKFINELTHPIGDQQDQKYLLRRHAIKDSDIPVKKKKKPKTSKKSPPLLAEDGAQHALNRLSTPQENVSYSGKKVPKQADKTGSSDETDYSDAGASSHWIALIIALLFIISVIIVIIAVTLLKNRGNLLKNSSRRGCDDLCPLKEHFQKPPSDIEHGWSTRTSTDYTTGRWRRESSIPSSRSPSRSLFGSKGKKMSVKRKSKIKKFKDNQQQTQGIKNKPTSKNTKVKKNRKVSIDKTRKSRESSVRDKIGHILRKDKRDCKCCSCANADEDAHGVCIDSHCKQRRISNLRDFVVLPESKDLKTVKKLTKIKSKKEASGREIVDTSSLENSPRKREEFRLKEKFKNKAKSPRASLVVSCNRETCELRKTPRGVT